MIGTKTAEKTFASSRRLEVGTLFIKMGHETSRDTTIGKTAGLSVAMLFVMDGWTAQIKAKLSKLPLARAFCATFSSSA